MIEKPANPLLYAQYLRKSSDEKKKQVLSIPAQNSEMLKITNTHGLTVRAMFEETETAFIPGRPIFRKMILGIERGEYNAILCWKLDRLARNMTEAAEIATLLTSGALQEIRTYERVYLPKDSLVMIMLEFTMATQYSRDLSTGVKRGQREKLSRGGWPGAAPVGYLNDTISKTILVDPVKAPFVRKTYELYATGSQSLSTVQTCVNNLIKAGGHAFSFRRRTVERILRSTFYHGLTFYAGEYNEGNHTPLVNRDLFLKVQKSLRNKSKRKGYRYKPFDYRGVFKCGECGCAITLEIQKGIRYWRCTKKRGTCAQHYLRETHAYKQLDAFFELFNVDERISDLLVQLHHQDRIHEMQALSQQVKVLDEKIGQKHALKKRLNTIYAEGTFTDAEYRDSKNDLIQEITSLHEELAKVRDGHLTRLEPDRVWISALKEAILSEKRKCPRARADFLKESGSNSILHDRKVTITSEKRWKIWADWKRQFAKDFFKKPAGYQLALLRQLLDSAR